MNNSQSMTPAQRRRMREELRAKRLELLKRGGAVGAQLDKVVAPRKSVEKASLTHDSVLPCGSLSFEDYIWCKQCGMTDKEVQDKYGIKDWKLDKWKRVNGIRDSLWIDKLFVDNKSSEVIPRRAPTKEEVIEAFQDIAERQGFVKLIDLKNEKGIALYSAKKHIAPLMEAGILEKIQVAQVGKNQPPRYAYRYKTK